MPKGYVIARIEVTDHEAYLVYANRATEAIKKFDGRVLVRGGKFEAMDGSARPRNVVVEFESFEQAKRYYLSEEYRAARDLRLKAGIGEVVIVEGVA